MGYSGVQFDPEKVDLFFESKAGKLQIIENGVATGVVKKQHGILSRPEITATAGYQNEAITVRPHGAVI